MSQTQPAHRFEGAPLRGTQSLVGVMAFVWKHPSLTGLEILWRWCAAAPLLWLAWHSLAPLLQQIPLDESALATMTFLEPVRSASLLAHQLGLFLPAIRHVGRWWVPLTLAVWTVAATLGRTAVLRRAAPSLQPQIGRMAGVNLVRAIGFFGMLCLWGLGLLASVRATIILPGRQGSEPNVVLFTAEAVGLTLAIFLLWSLLVWRLDLQPLKAMTLARLSTPLQRAELRSKLIETNLVMGVVRVALLVLAMTFSASPLPFQSQQTQAYINVWWTGVGLFYVVASDFFHVIRRVTYLRLLQSIATEANAGAASAS